MHVPVVPLSVEQLLKRLLLLLQVVELRAPPRQHMTVNQATVNVHKLLDLLDLFIRGTAEMPVNPVIRFVKGMTRHVHLVSLTIWMDQTGPAQLKS